MMFMLSCEDAPCHIQVREGFVIDCDKLETCRKFQALQARQEVKRGDNSPFEDVTADTDD
jgi:hypothetical protein